MRNLEITTYKPIDKTIAKHIEFYYQYELVNEEYYAFPSSKNVVIFIENAEVNYSDNKKIIKKNLLTKNFFYGLNKFTKPLFIKTEGSIKEFVIIFKTHGLAQFMKINVNNIPFFKIDEFDDFIKNNSSFFNYSIEEKIKSFERFLLTILNEKKDIDTVIKSVFLMQNEKLSIEEIAKECNCSYKKLYRLYQSHCSTTPIIVKKNIRFRTALKKIKNGDARFKLSDVAFDSGYYDQAFFNKAFKELTGESPKKFFKNVSILSNKDMYFKTLK